MSVLSGLGHVLSSIFGGDDGEDKKKKQQQQKSQPKPNVVQVVAPAQNAQKDSNTPFQQNVSPTETIFHDAPLQKIAPKAAPKNIVGNPVVDANTLAKVASIPVPAKPAEAPQSAIHVITHNPITDTVGSVVKLPLQFAENYSNTFANLGNKLAGGKNRTIQENMGTDPISRPLLKVSGATGTNAQLAGDVAQIGTAIVAPGTNAVAAKVGAKVIPKVAPEVLQKVIPKAVGEAVTGAGFNAAATAGNGGNLKQTAEAAGLGAAGGAAFGAAPLLKKVPRGTEEISPGIRGANPDPTPRPTTPEPLPMVPGETIHPQTAKELGVEDGLLETPAYQRQGKDIPVQQPNIADINDGLQQNAAAIAAEPHAAGMISEAFHATGGSNPLSLLMHSLAKSTNKADVRALVQRLVPDAQGNTLNRAVNHVTGADNVAEVAQALTEASVKAKMPTPELGPLSTAPAPEPAAAAPMVPEAPVAPATPPIASPEPVATPPVAPTVPEPVSAPAVTTPEVAPAPSPQTAALPTVPEPIAPETAPAAPRTHDALVRQLSPEVQSLKGKYGQRAVLNLDDLKQSAEGVVANLTPDELVQSFSGADPATMVTNPQGFAVARAALSKLAESPDDPAAAQTVKNILDGMAQFESKSGQGLRIVQEEFDNLPIPMKVRYIVKKIDAANADNPNYAPLADDPAQAALVEGQITNYLQKSQGINERVAAIQGQLEAVAAAAKSGEKTTANIGQLTKTLRDEQRALAASNGELVKYYTDLLPSPKRGQRVNDFARSMMLSSFTGRVNDIITTSANIANLGAQNVTQGLLAKAVNLFSPGKVTDTLKGAKAFVRGTAEGARQGVNEFGDTQYTGDLQKALKGNTGERTGLRKTNGVINRTVQAATEFATKASSGVTDQRLYQLADQEAQKAGLKGAMRRQYAEARTAVPSRQMVEQADQLHKEVNNLNENPITHTLNRVAASIEGKSAVGGFIKNQIMPFTSWLGGNIWNSVTDKNVVASGVKLANSLRKGDAEGIVRNLSKTVNNGAQAYALGWWLTQHGVITNTDAQGYNDAGAYFHVGDRYIPVGFAGFVAPSIVLGNAAYNGIHGDSKGSPATRIAGAAGDAVANLAKSVNAVGSLGADNNITRAFEAAKRPGGTTADGTATFGAGAAGQFIPGFAGDINATINNGLTIGGKTVIPDTLNPTHEASDTKVINPNSKSGTARDVPKSALRGLENRVPLASQTLPRKKDVAASDFVDRTTKGDRETAGGKVAKAKVKTDAEVAADLKARGVPDPSAKYDKGTSFDGAVKARFEEGKIDQAIEGLQLKLKQQESNKDIPPSSLKGMKDQIAKYQVHKEGHYAPEFADKYSSTSLSEWRNLGDPESDTHDPALYQKLFEYDTALADKGVSKNKDDHEKGAYYAKVSKAKSGSGRGGRSAESDALKKITSNTLGSTPQISNVSFGDLAPKKVSGDTKVPVIQEVKPGELIKKRKISVGKG